MSARPSSLVVIGASAGGIEPLKEIAAGLPPDLAAAVAIVLHVSPTGESRLPAILSRAGRLPVVHARDGEELGEGRIYVAPPDRHLLVVDGRCAVVRGPRENNARPAVDPLFRSAAVAFGSRVVAVVLSGTLADGVAGARFISSAGGTVIVQDPEEADFPAMPANAIARDHPDCVLELAAIAPAIVQAVTRLSHTDHVSDNGRKRMELETSYAALDPHAIEDGAPPGRPSGLSCPACGGVLWEVDDGNLLRFRCRVGHAYAAESALDGQRETVETALWAAFRALLERKELAERLAVRARERGWGRSRANFEERAQEALAQADLIRTALLERNGEEDA
jgi:two-component system chemotaxis response regulator CheB